ncbi:MFS transporter [Actinomadura oligospora]|uniref:MFS transporter n=1 Tax=Actinomadura oligospora TaxID=111804 RepID=UPI0004B10A7D|nr:MFS transporter [Actinomadura oligospora]
MSEIVEEVAAPDEPTEPTAPLRRNRDFLMLWFGAGLSMLGGRISVVAYPLVMIWQGGSTAGAGLVGFAALLPTLLVQLPAGVLVDRWDRRRLMIWCDVAGFAAMGSVGVALLYGHVWLPHLMAAAFVEGAATIFYRLAERAAVRNVVHPRHLPAALAQNEARGRAFGLIGGPSGSSLFALVRWSPFVVTAAGHALAFVMLLLIRRDFQTERQDEPRRLQTEIREGIGWLVRQRFLRAAVVLVAATNILFQVLSLALVVIVKESGGSPAAVGVISVVSGVGGVLGALSGSWWVKRLPLATIITLSFAAWTVLMPAVALTDDLVLLGLLFAGMTFCGAVMNVTAGVYQVRITPDAMQGRISSVVLLVTSGANSFGVMGAGFLLSGFGSTATLAGVGVVMLLITITAAVSPAVRSGNRIRLTDDPADGPDGLDGLDRPDGRDSRDSEEI